MPRHEPLVTLSYVTNSSWLLDIHSHELACDMSHSYVTDRDSPVCHELLLTYYFSTYILMSPPATCLIPTSRTLHGSFIRHKLPVTHSYVTNIVDIFICHTFRWNRLVYDMTHSYVTNSSWLVHMSRTAFDLSFDIIICCEFPVTPSHTISWAHLRLLMPRHELLVTLSYVTNSSWLLHVQSHEPACDMSHSDVTNSSRLAHMSRTPLELFIDFFTSNLMSPHTTCLIQTSRGPRDSSIHHQLPVTHSYVTSPC